MSKAAKAKIEEPESELSALCQSVRGAYKKHKLLTRMGVKMGNAITACEIAQGLRKPYNEENFTFVPPTPDDYLALEAVVGTYIRMLDISKAELVEATQFLGKEAERLPVWEWVKEVRGMGSASLGMIIGLTGNLSNYDNPAKVWKRLGIGMIPAGTLESGKPYAKQIQHKTLNAELAEKMGYRPQSNAITFVHKTNFIRACTRDTSSAEGAKWKEEGGMVFMSAPDKEGVCTEKVVHKDAYYVQLYIERKAYEKTRLNADGKPLTNKHAHYRASRWMYKRFIRDLWIEWNKRDADSTVVIRDPDALI